MIYFYLFSFTGNILLYSNHIIYHYLLLSITTTMNPCYSFLLDVIYYHYSHLLQTKCY